MSNTINYQTYYNNNEWTVCEVETEYEIAHFEENGETKTIHEHSFFEAINDRWLYVGATHSNHPPITVNKVGRNEPCPCGSGKKFKKCCALTH